MAVMAALAFMIHVLVNNKYVGYAVFIVFLIGNGILLSALDVSTRLANFNSAPSDPYSDMNTYGTSLRAWYWFKAYWWAFGGVLMAVALIFWVRAVRHRGAGATAWRASARNNTGGGSYPHWPPGSGSACGTTTTPKC
jgi:ABC-2 type transport system permease protein